MPRYAQGFLLLLLLIGLTTAGVLTYEAPARPVAFAQAVKTGTVGEVEGYLKHHSELVNQRDAQQRTPLHDAAERGHLGIVYLLLGENAEVNARSRDGRTPLHLAAERGNGETVLTLLRNGADAAAVDARGLTPLDLAAWNSYRETAALLISKGADVDIYAASALGMVERLGPLVNHNPGLINNPGPSGYVPLHWAARHSERDTAEWLLAKGARVNGPNADGSTPLHGAAARGSGAMVAWLISRGADVAARNAAGFTALHEAARTNNDEAVSALLAHGADAQARTAPTLEHPAGLTPLDLAAAGGQLNAATALLNHLRNPREQATEALPAAIKSGSREIVNLLLGKGAGLGAIDLTTIGDPVIADMIRHAAANPYR